MTTVHLERDRVIRVAAEILAAAAALALLTWGAVRLDLRDEPAALLYLVLVVLVSLRGSRAPALFVAIAGTVAFDYFFTASLVGLPQRLFRDAVTLVAFCTTAVVITRLVCALRSSEGRWRNVFENNPTMYFMVDGSGIVRSVNPTGAEQLGYTTDELVGQPVLNVFLEADKAAASEHVALCLSHLGQSMSWELRKIRKDGTMLWVRETARAVQLGNEPPVVLIACEDITASRAAQDQLRENEARLHGQASLLDLTHDAIFVRGPHNIITYWNRGAEQLYGWSRDEAVGRVTHELLRTVFPEPLDEIDARLPSTDRWEGELVHTKRDGTRVVVASRWSLQRDETGKPTGVMETNNDITERKRTGEELRRSEAYLAEAQRLSHTGSFGWPLSDNTITWSEETYRIFGFDVATRVVHELVRDRIHPDDRADVQNVFDRAQREQQGFELWHRVLLPDGSIKRVHVVARMRRDESGQVELVGAVMDVTERERAEEALQSAQAKLARVSTLTTMGELAASIAHELRQPLAAIAMNGGAALRWLDRGTPNLGEARDAAARIVREAQRADEVIRGLRALVSKSGTQRESLDMNDVVHEVLELVRGELRRSEVSVRAELAPAPQSVIGDRVQLQQVVLNLVMNAIEAMTPVADRARALVIRTERAGNDEVAVTVADSGPGLVPATAQRIFDPFFTTKANGLGMGLSICRSIVEAHGGKLTASPRSPHGTVFRFAVPMIADVASTSAPARMQQLEVGTQTEGASGISAPS